ncbi:MAG: Maf family protein [Steroidobacteraceae bacterium]|jgi:septum formation protein|nr:Maf family protein [Steroidobacteraceae bacterium]
MSAPLLTLASASPRRRQLLDQIGVPHRVRPADVDETAQPGESPADYALRVAIAKADAGWAADPSLPVLAADTAVALGTTLYAKPADRADGLAMLAALSGRTHRVLTAVALRYAGGLDTALSISEVTFRATTADERRRYWDTGEPLGKAGGYAVQGFAAVFVTRVDGSYSGVMGLPLAETGALLARAGVPVWQDGPPHGECRARAVPAIGAAVARQATTDQRT